MEMIMNQQLQMAFDFVQYTSRNVFLTGNAGTGKTTFLQMLKNKGFKRMVVVAPTGVAAINAGGVTIHSFFQMPFGPNVPLSFQDKKDDKASRIGIAIKRFNREKIKIIRSLDLLVIDEISMVRADLLDGIDEVLRRYRDKTKAFGGVQLLMIGDMHQLAPIAKNDEREILDQFYDTVFFFSSKALQQTNYVCIELTHIFRQSDHEFINLLNMVRLNKMTKEGFDKLNSRYIHDFQPDEDEGYIILTTHNNKAKNINGQKLDALKNKTHSFYASVDGDFPEYIYPTEYELELKEGAQVMFVKNDPSSEKLFFNGKIGKLISFEEEGIVVDCPEDDHPILVTRLKWDNIRYEIDSDNKEIREDVIGTFTQFPLKLAWAITVHKSQGLTFDKAVIDVQSAFAFGQVYVALSRCRNMDGLVLGSPLSHGSIKTDYNISEFSRDSIRNQPGVQHLEQSKDEFHQMLLEDLFNFNPIGKRIGYLVKNMKDNASVINTELILSMQEKNKVMQTDLIHIGDKFNRWLRQIQYEKKDEKQHSYVNERITKASKYFDEKINSAFTNVFVPSLFEMDNKEVRKTFQELIKQINEDLYVKQQCLKAAFTGFNIEKYLEVRAKSAIDYKMPRTAAVDKNISIESIAHPELFERIRLWRKEVSANESLPAYMVLRQKSLLEICNKPPLSFADINKMKGFGGKRRKQSLEEVYNIVFAYLQEDTTSL